MAVTRETICKLIGLATNQNPHIVSDQLTDEQIQTYALNIGTILKPDEIFTPADMDQFVEDDDAIYNAEEALAYAGAQDICNVFENAEIYAEAAKAAPGDVFIGEDGLAKLADWGNSQPICSIYDNETIYAEAATGLPADVFTGEDGMAKLVDWGNSQPICDIFDNDAIYAEAAKAAPADVFAGEDGTAKLIAWGNSQPICDIYDNATIYAEAADSTPEAVFTGEAGAAKLVAWATANLDTVAADVDGLAALDAWAIAAGYTKS